MNANERKYKPQSSDELSINDSAIANTKNIHPLITPPVAMTPIFSYQTSFICVHLRSFADIF